MLEPLHAAAARLALIHPALPYVLLVLGGWYVQALIRRYAPALWRVPAFLWLRDKLIVDVIPREHLDRALPIIELVWTCWQMVPSLAAGALFKAWLDGTSLEEAWTGALYMAFAPALHHLRKAIPMGIDSYRGQLGAPPTYFPKTPGGQS